MIKEEFENRKEKIVKARNLILDTCELNQVEARDLITACLHIVCVCFYRKNMMDELHEMINNWNEA